MAYAPPESERQTECLRKLADTAPESQRQTERQIGISIESNLSVRDFYIGKAANLTKGALSFDPTEGTLLRGTLLENVCRRGASILRGNAGGENTYALSMQVGRIDYFISHNWSMSRVIKFLGLCLHFNKTAALLTTCLFISLIAPFQILEVLPSMAGRTEFFGECKRGLCITVLAFPVFFSALLAKHDVLLCLGRILGETRSNIEGPVCFLDKTCIHQTDMGLQEHGIKKLGAFIANSQTILVLYSDIYIRKLWTIYEVACFSMLHTSRNVELLHTAVVSLTFKAWILCYFIVTIWSFDRYIPVPTWPLTIATVFAIFFIYSKLSRRCHRDLTETRRALESFRVQDALCFKESDRPVVEDNIVAFMIAKDYSRADKEATLEMFNHWIRTFVREILEALIGTSVVPYPLLVLTDVLLFVPKDLDTFIGVLLQFGYSDLRPWAYLFWRIVISSSFNPLLTRMLEHLMGIRMHLCGWHESVWMGGATALVLIVYQASSEFNKWLMAKATSFEGFNVFALAFVAYNLSFVGLSLAYFARISKTKETLLKDAQHFFIRHSRVNCDCNRKEEDAQKGQQRSQSVSRMEDEDSTCLREETEESTRTFWCCNEDTLVEVEACRQSSWNVIGRKFSL